MQHALPVTAPSNQAAIDLIRSLPGLFLLELEAGGIEELFDLLISIVPLPTAASKNAWRINMKKNYASKHA